MLDTFRGTMGLHLSARAVLKTPASVARIDQRLRRIDPNMPDTITPYREIPLTRGKVAIIDAEDWPLVSRYKWGAFSSSGRRKPHWYATATTPRHEGGKKVRLHRILLSAPKGVQVDHRDGDGLNNRRTNLRLCTHGQNQQNRKAVVSKSGYKGVKRIDKKPQWSVRWIAAIKKDGRSRHLGSYDTAEEAARAYDRAAVQLFGEFASLNFPQPSSNQN